MTPETFAAEFVAYNDFRQALGQAPVTREAFAAIVARHNATLAARALDEPTPEA